MDRKSSNNGGDLGYSNQESDAIRPRDDVPSGACAGGSLEEQLKDRRVKEKQKYDLRNRQSANAQASGSKSDTSSENDDAYGPTSDAQQIAYGMYTPTMTLLAISPQPGSLKENMANMTLEKKVQSTSSSVKSANENKCKKKLSDLGFNSRHKLAELLDPNGIGDLMPKLLKNDDCLDIWRGCHGGVDPAMGLIYTLAQSKLTTLEKFGNYASDDKPEESKELLRIIGDYTKNMSKGEREGAMKTRIDQLPFTLINKIAKEISAKQFPVTQQQAPLWKFIAGKAGIPMTSIDHLNMPANQGYESMTMKVLGVVNQRYPLQTVAWLANILLAAERNDVFIKLASYDDFCFDADGNHKCE